MTEQEQNDALEKLREPFPESAISHLEKGGTTLSYVGHAAATDRILSSDLRWNWEPFATTESGLPLLDYDQNGKPVGLWIRLTIAGVTHIGYGSCLPTKNEAVKELIGDAIRNAGMRFGIALELWTKGELESGHNGEASTEQRPAPQRPQQRQNAPRTQGSSNGGGNTSLLSEAQRGAILSIANKVFGRNTKEEMANLVDKPINQLSKNEASALIERLRTMLPEQPAPQGGRVERNGNATPAQPSLAETFAADDRARNYSPN